MRARPPGGGAGDRGLDARAAKRLLPVVCVGSGLAWTVSSTLRGAQPFVASRDEACRKQTSAIVGTAPLGR